MDAVEWWDVESHPFVKPAEIYIDQVGATYNTHLRCVEGT